MKNLNTLNKIYTGILVLLVIAIGVKLFLYKGGSRYYYSATVSAPKTYPIHVRNAQFILADGKSGNVATSDVNDLRTDWGYGGTNDPTTKERLPVKLVLEYASYRDQQFYKDTIDLPAETISDEFKNMGKKGIETSMYQAQPVYRLDFVVGVANKGNITVWLQGEKYEKELLRHHIKPAEPVGDDTYYEKRLSKKDYFDKVFYIDSALRADLEHGVDKDANYIDTPSHFKMNFR